MSETQNLSPMITLTTDQVSTMAAVIARVSRSELREARDFYRKEQSFLQEVASQLSEVTVSDRAEKRYVIFDFPTGARIEVYARPRPVRPTRGAPTEGPDAPPPGTPGAATPARMAA